MTEGGDEGARRLPADDFELHARKWTAEDGILGYARRLQEASNLDPRLVDDLEEAIREDDNDAYEEAMARFLEALADAREEG